MILEQKRIVAAKEESVAGAAVAVTRVDSSSTATATRHTKGLGLNISLLSNLPFESESKSETLYDNNNNHNGTQSQFQFQSEPAIRTSPLELSHHLTRVTKNRQASVVKGMYKYFFIPGIRNIAGGLPATEFFPFDTLEGVVARPERDLLPLSSIGGEDGEKERGGTIVYGKLPTSHHQQLTSLKHTPWLSLSNPKNKPPFKAAQNLQITVPKYPPPGTNPLTSISLTTALQYGLAAGYPPLLQFIQDFTFNHLLSGNPPYTSPSPAILLTAGNTDGFSKVCQLLLESGDSLLVEEFSYMNALQTAIPLGVGIVPIKVDEGGMCPDDLERVLEGWYEGKEGGPVRKCERNRSDKSWTEGKLRKPRVMYTVSIGQNPTGVTVGLERRKKIYEICEKHDVIIVEDEPYWHLQFRSSSKEIVGTDAFSHKNNTTTHGFLDSLTKSYLSLDKTGRVIRLDTFSKTIAPGCRLGWITAQPMFIERLLRITEGSTQQPSGFVQSLVAELLIETWGMDGWIAWLENIRDAYKQKMMAMAEELEAGRWLIQDINCAENYNCVDEGKEGNKEDMILLTKTELYTFTPPQAGMFLWLKINISSHPLFESPDRAAQRFGDQSFTSEYLMNKLWVFLTTKEGGLVLLCPGYIFASTQDVARDRRGWEYFRLSFATMSVQGIRETVRGFVCGIKKFWGLGRRAIEEIGKEELEVQAELGRGEEFRFC